MNLRVAAGFVGHIIGDVGNPVAALVFTWNVVGGITFKDDPGLRLLRDAIGKDGTDKDAKEKNCFRVLVPEH